MPCQVGQATAQHVGSCQHVTVVGSPLPPQLRASLYLPFHTGTGDLTCMAKASCSYLLGWANWSRKMMTSLVTAIMVYTQAHEIHLYGEGQLLVLAGLRKLVWEDDDQGMRPRGCIANRQGACTCTLLGPASQTGSLGAWGHSIEREIERS